MASRIGMMLSSVYVLSAVLSVECYGNVTTLILPGNNKTTIVKSVFWKNRTLITDIDIREENVPILKFDVFEGLSLLRTISIQKSNLSIVEENVFLGLRRLQSANFNYNKIRHVSANIFKNLPITEIFLKGNGIETVAENAFFNLRNLRKVDLSGNDIELLPKNLFVRTVNVKHLDLSYNKLRHFPAVPYRPYSFFDVAFANATRHEKTALNLSHNNFTFVSYYLLRGVRFIGDLRLDYNRVESISEYAFDDFVNVENFNLNFNNLREIGADLLEVLTAVENLRMANNPWKNDFICSFERWCEIHDKINYMSLRCPIKTIL